MSVNSEVNLKQLLRKIEYPLCAKEALNRIGKNPLECKLGILLKII